MLGPLCGEVAASCPLCGASNGSRPSWRLTVENLRNARIICVSSMPGTKFGKSIAVRILVAVWLPKTPREGWLTRH
jgi:hypothetical protein